MSARHGPACITASCWRAGHRELPPSPPLGRMLRARAAAYSYGIQLAPCPLLPTLSHIFIPQDTFPSFTSLENRAYFEALFWCVRAKCPVFWGQSEEPDLDANFVLLTLEKYLVPALFCCKFLATRGTDRGWVEHAQIYSSICVDLSG